MLKQLDHPELAFSSIHVAGTNGKGSVVAILEALLRASDVGLRVGKYTSPHLVSFGERIIIDGKPVSDDRVDDFLCQWESTILAEDATFFEATTAMALRFFAEDGVDVAVVETGLGGRLDSTNVLAPAVAVVTNIGIEHVEYLGNTVEQIAVEKGGIYKRDRPAVVGDPKSRTSDLLCAIAREHGATPIVPVLTHAPAEGVSVGVTGTTFVRHAAGDSTTFVCGLLGEHQAWNATTALTALEVSPWYRPHDFKALASEVLPGVSLPGRFQVVDRIIFDVAHNPAGTRVLAETLRGTAPVGEELSVLIGILADKDWRGMLHELSTVATRFIFTIPPSAPAGRKWDLVEVADYARESGIRFDSIADFDLALEKLAILPGRQLITGSFHTVGDAMARLQVSPLGR